MIGAPVPKITGLLTILRLHITIFYILLRHYRKHVLLHVYDRTDGEYRPTIEYSTPLVRVEYIEKHGLHMSRQLLTGTERRLPFAKMTTKRILHGHTTVERSRDALGACVLGEYTLKDATAHFYVTHANGYHLYSQNLLSSLNFNPLS